MGNPPLLPREEKQTGLHVAIFLVLFLPLVLYGFFEWRIYFPNDALLHAALVGALLTPFAMVLMLRRRTRLVSIGRSVPAIGLGQLLGTLCTLFVVLYWWSLVMFSVSLLLLQVERTERVFQIAVSEECTWKCARCKYEIGLQNWPGFSRSRLCADSIGPNVLVTNKVLVRGYFSNHAIYVSGVYPK